MSDSFLSRFDEEPADGSGSQDKASDPAGSEQPSGAPQKPKKRRKPLIIGLSILLAVVIIGLAIAGFYLNRVNKALDNMNRADTLPTYQGQPAPPAAPAGTNFLLMGSDDRSDGGGGRSDTLMVLHLNAAHDKAYLISFPRDMWVDIPEHGKAKINAAYAFGGPQLTARTMEQLVGVKMDHSAEVDFAGFIGLTDVLGGVEVTNKTESTTGPYHYPKGKITIKGDEALMYVRERKNLPNGDLDRAERQRDVMKAIVAKAMSPEVVGNPITFGRLVNDASKHVTVDRGLSSGMIRDLATGSKIRNADQVISMQAPITGFGTSPDGQSIDVVDEPKLTELATALKEDKLDAYHAKYPN